MLDLTLIQQDVDQDKKVQKICESCNQRLSKYLYILKSIFYGIFHVCEYCKEELDSAETPTEEIKTAFVEKAKSAWIDEPGPLR
jgi:uncharacterized protein with PIN domain